MQSTEDPAWWAAAGDLIDTYELPWLNPLDPGYPAWHQPDRAIHLLRPATLGRLVITDGLGGEALPEYFVHTADAFDELSGHWSANLLLELGRLVPGNATQLAQLITSQGPLTLSLELDHVPAGWNLAPSQGPADAVALMLGLPHPYANTARPLINVTLLRPAELERCLADGPSGRALIAGLLGRDRDPTLSDLDRTSVV